MPATSGLRNAGSTRPWPCQKAWQTKAIPSARGQPPHLERNRSTRENPRNSGLNARSGYANVDRQAAASGSMEATTLEPGTLIEHRYVIRRFIAAGGVAQVYA